MKCMNCGANVEDGASFCPVCGTKAQTAEQNAAFSETDHSTVTQPDLSTSPVGNNPVSKLSKSQQIIVIVCILAAVVLIVVLLGSLFGGNSKKGAVKDYYRALEKCDAGKMLKAVPKDYLEELMDELDCSKKELKEEVQDYLDDYYEEYDDIEVTFVDKETMDKDDIEDYFDMELDDDELNIKKAVTYELKVRYESDGGDDVTTENENMVVYKYEGSWYCMDAIILVAWAAYL